VLLHLHKSMTEVDRGELNNYLGVQLGVFGVLKLGAPPPPPPQPSSAKNNCHFTPTHFSTNVSPCLSHFILINNGMS